MVGTLITPVAGNECPQVVHPLCLCLAEILTAGFVLYQELARPEKVNAAPVAGKLAHWFFEASHASPVQSEDVKEAIPEGLGFRLFALFVRPLFGEQNGTLLDFIPT